MFMEIETQKETSLELQLLKFGRKVSENAEWNLTLSVIILSVSVCKKVNARTLCGQALANKRTKAGSKGDEYGNKKPSTFTISRMFHGDVPIKCLLIFLCEP